MKSGTRNTGHAVSLPAGAVIGASAALLWTLTASGILAWLILKGKLQQETVGYGSMVILLLGSILGGLIAKKKVKRQLLLTTFSAGAVYLMMLLAITALFFGGQYSGFGVTALLVLGGSGTAALMGIGKRSSTGSKRHKIRR